jgi:hypothetical protein
MEGRYEGGEKERIYPEWPIKEGFLLELKPTYFHNMLDTLSLQRPEKEQEAWEREREREREREERTKKSDEKVRTMGTFLRIVRQQRTNQ